MRRSKDALSMITEGDSIDAFAGLLMELGVHPDEIVDEQGKTALMLASWYGRTAMVTTLIRHGADVNKRSKHNWVALMGACCQGHTDIARILLDRQADVNVAEDFKGMTPLTLAACNGHADIVALLMKSGADVNAKSEGNNTPLMGAIVHHHPIVAMLLLDAGADVCVQNDDGEDALSFARLYAKLYRTQEIVELVERHHP